MPLSPAHIAIHPQADADEARARVAEAPSGEHHTLDGGPTANVENDIIGGERNLLAEQLGQTMLQMLTARLNEEAAITFATTITQPTMPGTPERMRQDRAWDLLSTRLGKLAGEVV